MAAHSPSQPPDSASVLVVDDDPVSRRFVELALGDIGSFVVETVKDATGAFDVLNGQLVDLIVSDTELPDMNGLQFYVRLCQERRLRSIPFVFLSANRSKDAKVVALRAGVDDYMVKPCDPQELAVRARALIERERRLRDCARNRSYTLAGDFSAIAFPDLVSIIEMGRRSGTLSIIGPSSVGQVLFDKGRVVHAAYGNLVGSAAFYRLMAEVDGQFEFSPGACELGESERTLTDSLTMLIMEGARIQDTESAKGGDESGKRVARRSDTQRPRSGSSFPLELRPPLVPEAVLAAQYEVSVRDGFALGELQVWTREGLAKWCATEVGRDRFHVHLIADMATGISSILSLGGAPTERWVLGSLLPEKKALGLSFFLRHDRLLDLVLLDARDPAAFQSSLRRTPSAVLLAPPKGDMMALGTAGRVALEGMLRELEPPAIVGVGNASLPGALAALGVPATESSTLRCTPGILGEGTCDLRSLLIKGIRLWSATPKAPRVERAR